MIQPKLFAQLGNQCFMISAAIAHAMKMGTAYSIPKKTINPRIWRTYFSQLPEIKSATKHYYKEPRHCFDPLPDVNDLTIEGYFQSEQYFRAYKKEIAAVLGFVHIPGDYVAVHIRRGDYLKYPDQFPVLPTDYYISAINSLAESGHNYFKFYSDDPKWCMQAFGASNFNGARIEFAHKHEALTDMKDIFNASAFIIANSTFSLFPALLRADNPTVIAPADDRWFGPAAKHLETHDLMPERFIKI